MSKVFDRAWAVVKATPEDDVEPDEGFHQLNDPNPTIAFGAAVRNHPFIAEMMRQQEEAYNPWCANLMDGENHGPHMCEFELVGKPSRSNNGYGGYYVELHCPKCNNTISGDVA